MVLVLLAIAVGLTLGLTCMASARLKLASSRNLAHAKRAEYVAESGIFHAMELLHQKGSAAFGDPNSPTQIGPISIGDSGGSYLLSAVFEDPTGDYVRITSTATVEGISRSRTARIHVHNEFYNKMMELGPEWYWRLHDVPLSGWTATDERGNLHGTYRNGVEHRQAYGVLVHSSNICRSFDGWNDYIDLGKPDIEGDKVTFLAWFNAFAFTKDSRIISKAYGKSTDAHFWMVSRTYSNGADRMRFRLKTGDSDTATKVLIADEVVETFRWYFVVCTYDGAKMRMFQNGKLVGEMDQSGELAEDEDISAWIGDNPDDLGSRSWRGLLDEVAVFKKALTAEQVENLYKARLPEVEIVRWVD